MNDIKRPLFSIIIPCYNCAAHVTKTLDSVLSQTFEDYEVILINDGSTDKTGAVCKEYIKSHKNTRFSLIEQKNRGIAATRNTGIKKAEGTYIAFLDSDDLWHKDKLKYTAEYFKNHPEADLTYTNVNYLNAKGERLGRERKKMPVTQNLYEYILLNGNIVSTSSVTVRKAKIEQAGGFNEDLNLNSVEDFDLWLRLSKTCKFAHIDKYLCDYIVHGKNISKKVVSHFKKKLNLYDIHLKSLSGKVGLITRAEISIAMGNLYRHALGEMIRSHRSYSGKLYKGYILKMLKHNPLYWRNIARTLQCGVRLRGKK